MSWYLTCSEQSHEKILLKNDVKTSVGRTPQTGITDKRCSRYVLLINISNISLNFSKLKTYHRIFLEIK